MSKSKICRRCGDDLPISAFDTYPKYNKRYAKSMCTVCDREKKREWRAENPEKVKKQNKKSNSKRTTEQHRKSDLRKKYGMTLEDFETMIAKQGHLCAICSTDLSELNTKNVHIDHCHTNGHVRGILCRKCNVGLGFFMDNKENLRSAIEYLEANDAK